MSGLSPGGRGKSPVASRSLARLHTARAIGVAPANRRHVLPRRSAPNHTVERDHAGAPVEEEGLQPFREWIIGRALPAWSTLGFDAAAGRFRERLDGRGAPLDVPHRAMAQARQIYVYSHAQLLGWHDGGELADCAMATLERDFAHESGNETSFAFSIDGRGGLVSDVRDAYTHAFVLFAIAWLHRITGVVTLLTLAERTDAFVRRHLVDAQHGGVFDVYPATTRTKRQNPLMHLLEAYLALERSAPGRGWLARAATIIDLFRSRLFDSRRGVLREHFAEDWSAHPDAALADVVEAGHHFEWVWLLAEYEQLAGIELIESRAALHDFALARGVSENGLVYDELASDGTVRKRSHRVWPHTEAIKAAGTRRADGDARADALGEGMADVLLERFLDRPFTGGWIDHISAEGAPLVDYVPASSLYHLMFAAADARERSLREPQHATAHTRTTV
jgi:mannose/cellobiose epimerase-like protein (N-acyl-D-glucosamine 2-epimerase family)